MFFNSNSLMRKCQSISLRRLSLYVFGKGLHFIHVFQLILLFVIQFHRQMILLKVEQINSPMTLASSSVRGLLRNVFLTRSVFPEGSVAPVFGMGGSPSFCCSLSAMTRNALRPIFILCRTDIHKIKI